jgi:hypothetical protein
MSGSAGRCEWAGLLVAAFAAGCNNSPTSQPLPSGPTPAAEEAAVREQFAALQAAVKARDADRLWDLLSSKSQADAERAATAARTAYDQAGAEGKAKQAASLGLPGADVAKLTGPGFLKTRRFQGKYEELVEGKVGRVDVQGDSATVHWDDAEGDKEKTIFVREGGRWKAWLSMPRDKKP